MSKQPEDEVRASFDRAIKSVEPSDELLVAVRLLVRDLRREGQAPETVIVTLKELCGVSQLTIAADTDSSTDLSAHRKLSDEVIKTAIQEYYSGDSTGRQPWRGYALEVGEQLR